jgi:hypothetical protein
LQSNKYLIHSILKLCESISHRALPIGGRSDCS